MAINLPIRQHCIPDSRATAQCALYLVQTTHFSR